MNDRHHHHALLPGLLFVLACVAGVILLAFPASSTAQSTDRNQDGRTDQNRLLETEENAKRAGGAGSIGIIETGGYVWPLERLQSLCFEPALVAPDAGLDALQQYGVIYLPVQWAQQDLGDYDTIEAQADAYRTYVQEGGNLLVEQPNPYQQPDDRVTPDLLPYPITFYNNFDGRDYPPTIVAPNHPVTKGLAPEEVPFPADQMLDVDSRYEVLVQGSHTEAPSVVATEYGAGRIVVHTAHPADDESVTHPIGSRAYMQMLAWLGATACPVFVPAVLG